MILLAVLVVVIDDSLIRLNALKQLISLAVNVSAAVVFLFLGRIDWTITLVMAIAALIGGAIGGAIASRVPAKLLRCIVIVAASECRPSTSRGCLTSRVPIQDCGTEVTDQRSEARNRSSKTSNAEHRTADQPRDAQRFTRRSSSNHPG